MGRGGALSLRPPSEAGPSPASPPSPATTVWAVGSHAAGHNSVNTLIEHWDGATWSVVASPRLPNGSFLTGVAAASTQDVWAVGDQPGRAIFDSVIEHWDGTSWKVIASPQFTNGSFLSAVAATSSSDAWAVGDSNSFSTGLVEHWNARLGAW